jgi:hypothetical protein
MRMDRYQMNGNEYEDGLGRESKMNRGDNSRKSKNNLKEGVTHIG